MEVFNFKAMKAWLLAFFIVLIPIWLSDLLVGPRPTAAPSATPAPAPAAKPSLPLKPPPSLDREAFLASFTRQAGEALITCVKESLGPSGSVTFIARLTRRGELTGVRLIEPRALDCAVKAAREMKFEAVAKTLSAESLELTWRFDW